MLWSRLLLEFKDRTVLDYVFFVQLRQVRVSPHPSLHHDLSVVDFLRVRVCGHLRVLLVAITNRSGLSKDTRRILGTDNTIDNKFALSVVFILLVQLHFHFIIA